MADLFAGTAFERAMPIPERRRWGRFYTAPDWVDLILRLCVRSPTDSVLDPSCGAGVFLERAAAYMQHLGPTSGSGQEAELWGVEIDPQAAALATQNLKAIGAPASILHADFFALDPQALPAFDCIAGNPPYTRQEWLGEVAAGGDKGALISRALGGARLSRRAGAHAYFLIHAARFLRPGGRLGFIVSNSWLDVDYGLGLQAFLLQRFCLLALIESKVERWFSDARVNTCLVLLERCDEASRRNQHPARFVQLNHPLQDYIPPLAAGAERWSAMDRLASRIVHAPEGEGDGLCVRTVPQGDLSSRQPAFGTRASPPHKWGILLRAPQVYLDTLARSAGRLVRLREVARIRRGYTAGANRFFYLSRAQAAEWNIEDEFLRPLIKSPRDCQSLFIRPQDLAQVALVIPKGASLRGTQALRYIEWGESQGFHQRPTCVTRERWYDLGDGLQAHMAWIKGIWTRHLTPLLAGENIVLDQQLYGLELHEPALRPVIGALLNSTWAALCAELGGRMNLGEGILWIAAYEAAQLPLPNPQAIPADQAAQLAGALTRLAQQPVLPVWDQIEAPERRQMDEIIFDRLELNDAERRAVRQGTIDLVRARLARARSARAVLPQGQQA